MAAEDPIEKAKSREKPFTLDDEAPPLRFPDIEWVARLERVLDRHDVFRRPEFDGLRTALSSVHRKPTDDMIDRAQQIAEKTFRTMDHVIQADTEVNRDADLEQLRFAMLR